MGDDLMPDEGPFISFLNWLDRPGQVVRNLLRGNPGAAGRQALDFLGEIPDALLPGNMIPDATTKEDYVAPHELVGMDDNTPWYARVPTDIGLGILTDPLSLIGVGEVNALGKGGAAVAREALKEGAVEGARAGLKVGVPFVPSLQKTIDIGADVDPFRNIGRAYDALTPQPVQDALSPVGRAIRSTFGAERLSPEAEALRNQARAATVGVNRAGSDAVNDYLSGSTAEDRANMVRVLGNIVENPNGGWSELLANSDPRNPLYDIAKQSDELAPLNVGPFDAARDTLYERISPVPRDPNTGKLMKGLPPEVDPATGETFYDPNAIHYLQKAIPEEGERQLSPLAQALGMGGAPDDILDQAFPRPWNDPRYASGIDLTNDILGAGPERIRTFTGDTGRTIEDSTAPLGEVIGFKTDRAGSGYTVDGPRTTRTKVASAGIHAGDQGLKETSERTVYVPPDVANKLGVIYASGLEKKNRIDITDGNLRLTSYGGRNADGSLREHVNVFPYNEGPAVGLHPVEFLPNGWHIGSKITQVERAPSDAARLAKSASLGVSGWESADDWITDPLTGGKTPRRANAPRVELPSSATDRLNEMMGGPKADIVSQSVRDAPEVTDSFDMLDNQIKRLNDRVDALGLPEADAERLKGLLAKRLDVVHNQYKELIQDYPAFYKPIGRDIEREMPADYAQGRYDLPEDNESIRDAMVAGNPSALKAKTLRTGKDRADFLNSTGAKPVLDIADVDATRMAQQSRIVQKSIIGQGLIKQWAERARLKRAAGDALSDAEKSALEADGKTLAAREGDRGASFNAASESILKEMAEKGGNQGKEDAQVLGDLYRGLPPQWGPLAALAKVTKPWKASVVFGLGAPKVGSLFRNRLSGAPMVAATPGAEGALGAMANPVNVAKDVIGAVMEGMGLGGKGQVFDDLRTIEDAYKQAGGRASNAVKMLNDAGRSDLAGAVENGVLDSFTSAEKLRTDIAKTGWKKWVTQVLESPARMFQATEHSMRLQVYQKILESGKSPAEAAKLTTSALYDYGSSSAANRTLRTLIPFGQFQAKAIPQQAAWIARNPAVGVASAQAFGNHDDEPIYPYLSEHAGFSLGHNDDGTLAYVGGFGLPEESLSMIPGLGGIRETGRQIERNVVASANPLLKAGYSAVSGRDPYFGTPAFTYDKIPLLGHEGAAGRAYNDIVNLGVAPVSGVHGALQQAQAAMGGPDHDHGIGVTLLDMLTGANVVDVDQNRALQQILQNQLATDPNIQHYDSLYSQSNDPDTQALLQDFREVQARIKRQRKASRSAQ